MAAEHAEINTDPQIARFFAGEVTATDYYATRK